MELYVGQVVIKRSTDTKHIVTKVRNVKLGCGCTLTKNIKISNVLQCDQIVWHKAEDFRLFDKDDF